MDQFMSYGEILRRERQRQGIDLASMSQRLHIRPDILSSIEDSDFDRMPARGYSKNMIRAYARALGLDEQQMLESYLNEVHYHELGGIRAPSSYSRSSGRNRSGDVSYRTSRPLQDGNSTRSRRGSSSSREEGPSFLSRDRSTGNRTSLDRSSNREKPSRSSSTYSRSRNVRGRGASDRSDDLDERGSTRSGSSGDLRSSRSKRTSDTRTSSRNLPNTSRGSNSRSKSGKSNRAGGGFPSKISVAGLFGSGRGTDGTKINRSFNTIGSTPPYAQSGRDSSSRIPRSLSEINLPLVLGIVCAVILLAILFAILSGGAKQNATEVPSIPISGLTDTSDTQENQSSAEPTPTTPSYVEVKYSIPSGEKSWLEIYQDGSTTPESAGVVDGPVNKTIEVTGSLTIKAANPDSVTVTADGEKLSWSKESSSGYYVITIDYAQFTSSSSSSSASSSSQASSSSSSSYSSSSRTTSSDSSRASSSGSTGSR